jgi:hypothetical protein
MEDTMENNIRAPYLVSINRNTVIEGNTIEVEAREY